MSCVFMSLCSLVCDGIWLFHCCRRLKKRGVDKVYRPKVNVSAGGRYTAEEKPLSTSISRVCDSGFSVE